MGQLQHNMLVAGTRKSVLSIINGGGKCNYAITRQRIVTVSPVRIMDR
jgi:hypothetical protein